MTTAPKATGSARRKLLRDRSRLIRGTGLSGAALLKAMRAINHDYCDPPLDDTEVVRIAAGADESIRPVRNVLQVAEFLEQPAPPEQWIVEGMLPTEGLAEILGGWKEGKTLASLQAGLCISSGSPFMNRQTRQGAVLLIEEEGGIGVLQSHIRTQAASLGLLQGLRDLPLHIAHRQRFRLDTEAGADDIAEEAERVGASAVLVGPLAQVAAIEENSNDDMNTVARLALDVVARRPMLFCIAHHRRKQGTDSRRDPKSVRDFFETSRGGGALVGAIDAGLGISRDPEALEGMLFVLLRNGRPFTEGFTFDPSSLTIHPRLIVPGELGKAPADEVEAYIGQRWEDDQATAIEDVVGKFGCSRSTAQLRLNELELRGVVMKTEGARGKLLYRPRAVG